MNSSKPNEAKVFSVKEINRLVRELLEQSFPSFWISGEISNFISASSGHWYFSLKDDEAQVRCTMFKNKNMAADWTPKNGEKIEAKCFIGLYEARGEYQLNIDLIRHAGAGLLSEAFNQLKERLLKEGLFETSRKKLIPQFPKSIGVITSPTGAAIEDILTTLKRRSPHIPIFIYPSLVQGKEAPLAIVKAIETANIRMECDVLILARGGGSIEDLWAFNEEIVARAIVTSKIPTITGVGHETDTTIADFVSDLRAPTPTGAAELVTSHTVELVKTIQVYKNQLNKVMAGVIRELMQKIDYLEKRLISPRQQIQRQKEQIHQYIQRINQSMKNAMIQYRLEIDKLKVNLDHLSPHAVLSRGYSIITNVDGQIVNNVNQLKLDDKILIQLNHGQADANISDLKN
ncbi:exodeoxyribonuclease VII large subunit [Candidatus Methylopumilus rimovensis]|uniref:Exodeoxyribonuclease 7 large subunit n=1 Tax=Candidatus Methylopumilus rimovensis TaxID=2588535 RepID=A0AAE6FUE1_9PROT|nr:exodeoxyribonuclease VII large subunit [Candidatus Methylopumilus rimovensis]QDD14167.1 exodeoxyribonuclease VII large subunit [Candidatus Methylopumilus rimovensis]